MAGVLAWMAFQWGFGNDILMPWFSAGAFDAIDNGSSWSSGITAVGVATAVGFLFWAATQIIDVVVVLTGLRMLPGVTNRVSRFLRRNNVVVPYREMKWSTRWIIAYASGASVLCLVDAFATGQPGLKNRWGMITTAVLLSAGSIGLVVFVGSGAAMVGKRIPATEDEAEALIGFAKNPLTWIGIFSGVFLFGRLRSWRTEG